MRKCDGCDAYDPACNSCTLENEQYCMNCGRVCFDEFCCTDCYEGFDLLNGVTRIVVVSSSLSIETKTTDREVFQSKMRRLRRNYVYCII